MEKGYGAWSGRWGWVTSCRGADAARGARGGGKKCSLRRLCPCHKTWWREEEKLVDCCRHGLAAGRVSNLFFRLVVEVADVGVVLVEAVRQ